VSERKVRSDKIRISNFEIRNKFKIKNTATPGLTRKSGAKGPNGFRLREGVRLNGYWIALTLHCAPGAFAGTVKGCGLRLFEGINIMRFHQRNNMDRQARACFEIEIDLR
jgi:hypothetical protein